MTYINSAVYTKIGTFVLAGTVLAFLTASGAKAADNEEMVFDDMSGLFTACLLDGESTGSETETTISCTTPGGQTTECDKNSQDPAQCSTIISTRTIGGRFRQTAQGGDMVIAPSNRTVGRGGQKPLLRGTLRLVRK